MSFLSSPTDLPAGSLASGLAAVLSGDFSSLLGHQGNHSPPALPVSPARPAPALTSAMISPSPASPIQRMGPPPACGYADPFRPGVGNDALASENERAALCQSRSAL